MGLDIGGFIDLDNYAIFLKDFYRRCIWWELKFAWVPHQCLITRKTIWLEFAYRGTARSRLDWEFRYDYHWHKKKEHIIWQLKQ